MVVCIGVYSDILEEQAICKNQKSKGNVCQKDRKNTDKQPHIWKNLWWQMPQSGNSHFDTWVTPKNSSGIGMFGIA